MIKFLHTADWQLGKPFAGVDDSNKRATLQNERFAALQRLAALAREHQAEFVLVAGDLFDSATATKATVSAACSAIGAMGVPVYAIPGNHDHGGPGSLWEQGFFQAEQALLAPNFRVLLKAEPIELPHCVLFPCPLLRRHESGDPTAWLRSRVEDAGGFGGKPTVVLAHGSVMDFGAAGDSDDELGAATPNQIALDRLPAPGFDYVALGDWHGTKQVGPKAWYSGTPEPDRFTKGGEHDPGNVLLVEVGRGEEPLVTGLRTAGVAWHELEFRFAEDAGVDRLEALITETIGGRVNRDLLRLDLTGSLGIEAAAQLERQLELWAARLIRLKLDNRTTVAPTPAELDALTRRVQDPLLSRVAGRLVAGAAGGAEEAQVARVALRELYAACSAP